MGTKYVSIERIIPFVRDGYSSFEESVREPWLLKRPFVVFLLFAALLVLFLQWFVPPFRLWLSSFLQVLVDIALHFYALRKAPSQNFASHQHFYRAGML